MTVFFAHLLHYSIVMKGVDNILDKYMLLFGNCLIQLINCDHRLVLTITNHRSWNFNRFPSQNVVLMLSQCWPNIKPTFCVHVLILITLCYSDACITVIWLPFSNHIIINPSEWEQSICITFVQCWTNVKDEGWHCTDVIQMFCVCWVCKT